MDTPRPRPLTDWLLLTGFCAFLFFFGIAHFGLVGADEPRYAQVAREMLARHDLITPTLGGKPWLEKPVLYYWQAMLAFGIFGVSDWAARLPSAIDATLMVVAVYLFLKRFRSGIELDGALMTASSAGIIGFARAASMDMALAAAFTIAMLAWYAWHQTSSRRCLTLFYLFVGLSGLAKGPVGPFLAAAIIVIFAMAKAEYRLVGRTLWIPGILLFCAVTLPWYVAVQLRNPEFFRVFILEHNLARFGTNLYRHPEPFWYYLPVMLIGLVPWTVFVIAALVESMRTWWIERCGFLQTEDAFNAFLVIWLVVPVVFFSISQSKLPGYILPALPAGTLLLADYVRRHIMANQGPAMGWAVLHSVTAALPVIPALLIQYVVFQHRLPWGSAAEVALALAAILAIGLIATLRSQYGFRMLRFVTLVPVVLVVAAALRIGAPALDSTLSVRPVFDQISRLQSRPLPLAVCLVSRDTEYGLAFYANQAIDRYELGQVPSGEHLVVALQGAEKAIAKRAAGRRVSYLGSFAPQHLDYFWVSAESGN